MTQQTLAQPAKTGDSSQAKGSENPNRLPPFLRRERLEPTLVIVTACAIAASILAERLGAPPWLILGFNILSYVAGGVIGLQAGIESLVHHELNVDLLM